MSYAYPVYEDKVNKTNVRFYHCSDKKSNVRVHKTDYNPGTILDENMEPLFVPRYSVAKEATRDHNIKLRMLDCTVINLYYMDSEWYMGTKNSWNIRKLQDFTPITYGEFFDECLAEYPNFSMDVLDKTQMYTLLFTNPKCHLFENECKVYVYDEHDPLADYFDVLPEEKWFDNYILLSTNNSIFVHQSSTRELCLRNLYSDRRKLYSREYRLSVAKSLISAMCKTPIKEYDTVVKFLLEHVNTYTKNILTELITVFTVFEASRKKSTSILNVEIPKQLSNLNNWAYNVRNIGFFVNLYKSYLALSTN